MGPDPEAKGDMADTDSRITRRGQVEPKIQKKNMTSIVSHNVRSLQANGAALDDLLDQGKYDIIALQEIWKSAYVKEGYDLLKLERTNRNGGGVGILSKSTHKLELLATKMNPHIEAIIAENKTIQIFNIYRPPSGKIKDYLSSLKDLLTAHYKKNKIVCVCGDFNINLSLDKWETSETFDLLAEFNLICLTSNPTRVTTKSISMIDAIFTNYKFDLEEGVILSEVSDHLAPFINIAVKRKTKDRPKKVTSRNTSSKNLKNLDKLLSGTDWDQIDDLETESAHNFLADTITELTDIACPLVTISANKSNSPSIPWMTPGLLKSRSTKLRLYKTFIKTRLRADFDVYRKYRNIYNKVLRRSKENHWSEFYQKNFHNSRLIWNETKKILGKFKQKTSFPNVFGEGGKLFEGNKDISDGFNSYFEGVGRNLAEKFGPSNDKFEKYLNFSHDHKFSFEPVNEVQVENIIRSLESKKSSSFDNLSNYMVKMLRKGLTKPLTKLINKSLKDSLVPSKLKLARIVPLHKSGKKDTFNNYRPISLLSVLSKLLEKVAYIQIYDYFNEHFLSNNQFGFRSRHETQHCILNFLKNIWENRDCKMHVGIFLDLRKAFDTVNHNILLRKLKFYGFDEAAVSWVRHYLTGRKQAVDLNGTVSNFLEMTCGVPQGSILGPLFFIIYINDLPNASKLFASLFADDTTYQHSGNSITEIEQFINNELRLASNWFDANRLTLHPGKTQFMVFMRNRRDPPKLNLKILGVPIKQCGEKFETKTITFLGVVMDEKLSWKAHVNKVATKIRSANFMLNLVKNTLPEKLRITLYNALVKPHIEYCLGLYGRSPSIATIEKLQKRAIRITFRASYTAHAEPLLKRAKTLKVNDLYKVNTCTFMYKHVYNGLPNNIQAMFKFHPIKNRQLNIFEEQKASTSIINSLPSFTFPKLWNEEFGNGELIPTTKAFKKEFKNFIIDSYYTKCDLKDCYSCHKSP